MFPAPTSPGEFERQIAELARSASLEIAPGDDDLLESLREYLPPRTVVYVVHTPQATLDEVVQTAIAVQARGFEAWPHFVARRFETRDALDLACAQLGRATIDRALVVAGDDRQAAGPYTDTLDLLKADVLLRHGIGRIAVAGHPEGHRAIGQTLLWRVLHEKQTLARRAGLALHVVTQFGFDPAAVIAWERSLAEHGIGLPVRVGMAGPATLPQLIDYAMQCGAGASIGGALRSMAAMRNIAGLALSPDQMLSRIARHVAGGETRIAGVHFYPVGGAAETARWLRAVADRRFTMNPDGEGFTITA